MMNKNVLMRSPIIRIICGGSCVLVFLGVIYYYGQMLKKEYASNCLGFLLQDLESASNLVERQRKNFLYSSYIIAFNKIVDRNLGYWKSIYKLYHVQASLFLMAGRLLDSLQKLKMTLKYHPYYPMGYKMMGNIYGLMGLDSKKEACGKVCDNIFSHYKLDKQDMTFCLNF